MKNFFKVLGIISLVLIIGFGVVACSNGDDDDDDNNSSQTGDQTDNLGTAGVGLTVTNYPEGTSTINVAAFKDKTAPTTRAELSALGTIILDNDIFGYILDLSKPAQLQVNDDDLSWYTGSDNLLVFLRTGSTSPWRFAMVQFTSGSATVDWNTMTDETTLTASEE